MIKESQLNLFIIYAQVMFAFVNKDLGTYEIVLMKISTRVPVSTR